MLAYRAYDDYNFMPGVPVKSAPKAPKGTPQQIENMKIRLDGKSAELTKKWVGYSLAELQGEYAAFELDPPAADYQLNKILERGPNLWQLLPDDFPQVLDKYYAMLESRDDTFVVPQVIDIESEEEEDKEDEEDDDEDVQVLPPSSAKASRKGKEVKRATIQYVGKPPPHIRPVSNARRVSDVLAPPSVADSDHHVSDLDEPGYHEIDDEPTGKHYPLQSNLTHFMSIVAMQVDDKTPPPSATPQDGAMPRANEVLASSATSSQAESVIAVIQEFARLPSGKKLNDEDYNVLGELVRQTFSIHYPPH
jgi:hypothetical protein